MGCDGCLTSEKEIQAALKQIEINAKNYAVDHELTLAIYQLPDKSFAYVRAEQAGGYPVIKYISPHRDV